jgi:hypothetical protein
MNDLLTLAIEWHGGMRRWDRDSVSVAINVTFT